MDGGRGWCKGLVSPNGSDGRYRQGMEYRRNDKHEVGGG